MRKFILATAIFATQHAYAWRILDLDDDDEPETCKRTVDRCPIEIVRRMIDWSKYAQRDLSHAEVIHRAKRFSQFSGAGEDLFREVERWWPDNERPSARDRMSFSRWEWLWCNDDKVPLRTKEVWDKMLAWLKFWDRVKGTYPYKDHRFDVVFDEQYIDQADPIIQSYIAFDDVPENINIW